MSGDFSDPKTPITNLLKHVKNMRTEVAHDLSKMRAALLLSASSPGTSWSGRPTSSTPRRHSSSSSMPKISTRPDGGGACQRLLHGAPSPPRRLARPGS
eukprot:504914-Pyramimonas_sp.AAC.1